jgi:hypothetical protein
LELEVFLVPDADADGEDDDWNFEVPLFLLEEDE